MKWCKSYCRLCPQRPYDKYTILANLFSFQLISRLIPTSFFTLQSTPRTQPYTPLKVFFLPSLLQSTQLLHQATTKVPYGFLCSVWPRNTAQTYYPRKLFSFSNIARQPPLFRSGGYLTYGREHNEIQYRAGRHFSSFSGSSFNAKKVLSTSKSHSFQLPFQRKNQIGGLGIIIKTRVDGISVILSSRGAKDFAERSRIIIISLAGRSPAAADPLPGRRGPFSTGQRFRVGGLGVLFAGPPRPFTYRARRFRLSAEVHRRQTGQIESVDARDPQQHRDRPRRGHGGGGRRQKVAANADGVVVAAAFGPFLQIDDPSPCESCCRGL